jgi:hypothetical protein
LANKLVLRDPDLGDAPLACGVIEIDAHAAGEDDAGVLAEASLDPFPVPCTWE